MRPARPKLAAFVAAAVLAAPAGAWAQGAVNEQYRDPFAGQGEEGSQAQQPASEGDTTSSPAPSASPPAASTAPQESDPVATTAELPRTGLPAVLIAMTGGALVAAGTGLRRRLR